MVNPKMECIFSRIPKTGSTSIMYSITSNRRTWRNVAWVKNPEIFDLNHIPLPFLKEVMHKERYNNFFKFSFVRNPWARAYSQYRYAFQWNQGKKSPVKIGSFEDFVHRLDDPSADWYSKTRWTQAFYCQGVDFIGRFENLHADYKEMRRTWWAFRRKAKWGIIHKNKNTVKSRKPYQGAYTEETKKIIATKYEEDIDLFKYTF